MQQALRSRSRSLRWPRPQTACSSIAAFSSASSAPRATFEALTAAADPAQLEFMKEMVIQVNEHDEILGPITKKDSHFHDGVLHRAFSVFLFNSQNELLIQKRAMEKITFPSYWANTCCSHPLFRAEELEDHVGVKRAAIRKLEHELGIPSTTFDVEDLKYVTTVLYKAASCPNWTEYEVDHILLARRDVTMEINENEVEQVEFVAPNQLDALLQDRTRQLSPWFRLIATNLLPTWWKNLDQLLEQDSTDRTIHNYCEK